MRLGYFMIMLVIFWRLLFKQVQIWRVLTCSTALSNRLNNLTMYVGIINHETYLSPEKFLPNTFLSKNTSHITTERRIETLADNLANCPLGFSILTKILM